MKPRSGHHPYQRHGTLTAHLVIMVAAFSPAGLQAARGEPPTYAMQFLNDGFPTAINDCGAVVGSWLGSPGRAWFADQAGNVVVLPVPTGARETKANDINDEGLVVGTATFTDGTPRACSWSLIDEAWEVTLLASLPVSFGSYGTAVNDLGEIVGTNIGRLGSHAVLYTGPDGPIDLYDLGLTKAPVDINNARQVAGGQLVLDLDDLTVTDIGVPEGSYVWSSAVAMNDAGQIAARSVTASGSYYPVASVFDPGAGWRVLSGPATGNTSADINGRGDVLIFIQSSWGQQPFLRIDGSGTYRVQDLLDPGLEFWFTENIGAMAMNDRLQLALVMSNFVSGERGAAVLTPMGDPADVDRDGLVGFADLLAVLGAWGECTCCPEDIDGDGAVGFPDVLRVLSGWGSGG